MQGEPDDDLSGVPQRDSAEAEARRTGGSSNESRFRAAKAQALTFMATEVAD